MQHTWLNHKVVLNKHIDTKLHFVQHGCNEVKFEDCWYKILEFTFGKFSWCWSCDARLHILWNSKLCGKVDIVFCDITETQGFCWWLDVGRPDTYTEVKQTVWCTVNKDSYCFTGKIQTEVTRHRIKNNYSIKVRIYTCKKRRRKTQLAILLQVITCRSIANCILSCEGTSQPWGRCPSWQPAPSSCTCYVGWFNLRWQRSMVILVSNEVCS